MKNTGKSKVTGAIELLMSDHRAVEHLFKQYEAASGKPRKIKLAEQICLELSIHTTIEEKLFYPAVRGFVEDHLLDEAHVEHDGAKMMIAEIMAGSPDEPFYDAKVKVLSEMIKHHVKEEEQRGGLFAQAKKSGLEMAELGASMASRKSELKKSLKASGVPTPTTRTLRGATLDYGSVMA